ncbi:MAG: hypothetical protein Q9170_004822 [Blastenia crenularia]
MYGVRYIQIGISLIAGSTYLLATKHSLEPITTFRHVATHATAVLLGLYSSLLAYRLLWHPLHRFPGPFGARVSSLWLSSQIRNGNAHKKMLDLHRKYGNFIRIGSSDLAIIHPLGVPAVYGQGSLCRKATWYDEDWPRSSLHTTRDHAWHGQRRRIWSPAFSDKALRGYEARIRKYTSSLAEQMSTLSTKPVDASAWFKYFAFDVMGDLAFNKDFEMLAKGEAHWTITLLNEALGLQALKLPTWIFRILLSVPRLAYKYWKFIDYCDQQLENRIRNSDKPDTTGNADDIFASLLPDPGITRQEQLSPQELLTLRSDSRTIIVAGSDTTASALTHIFYYLARCPPYVDLLRTELHASEWADPSTGETSHVKIQKALLLNAVINETLRLHPAVSTTLTRKTPPSGISVGSVAIPGDMTVWCPQWVLSRDENLYERAEEWVPERWTTRPEMIRDKAAYAPFSTGPYGCIGRPLALMELRTVIATLVSRFNFRLAEGEDGRSLLEDSRDQFTFNLGHLFLVFTPRGKK